MRKPVFLLLFISLIGAVSCSKFDPFEPLSEEQIEALLTQAKANSSSAEAPCEPLSAEEIQQKINQVKALETEQVGKREIALLETNMGTIAIAFYTELAPEHTKSFKRLVTNGFYDCTRFHRILKDFVIQGGDILTRDANPDNDGTGGPGYQLDAEFNGIPHDLGILSMARSNDLNSAGSQFFICLSRERTAALDGKYTVFGKVIGGLDVVKALGNVETTTNRWNEPSVPVEPMYIKKAYMVKR